jgi:GR25 family glycosyltransferase involved in LPS biosynthesis
MQIFYINLDSDLIKNEQMQLTLSSLGLNESTQRFPGILANKPLHVLSNSETGCLLSHQQLLSNLSNHHSTIIFEDDVIFWRGYTPVVWDDVILLCTGKQAYKEPFFEEKLFSPAQQITTHRLPNTSMPGAVGYGITPKGAQKLIEYYKTEMQLKK